MTALNAVGQGLRRAAGAKRLWLIYYLATLLFAGIAALPFIMILERSLGRTLWADRMLDNFNLGWVAEFIELSGGWPAASTVPALLVLGGAYLLLATFLAGGAVTVLSTRPERWDATLFWGACGRNFPRLFRLGLYSGLFYFLVLFINGQFDSLRDRIWSDGLEEGPVIWFGWGSTAVTLLLFALVNCATDYARVRLVLDDSRKAFRTIFAAFGFVLRHPILTGGTYAGVFAVLAVAAAAGHFLTRAIPHSTVGWLLLLVLAQQAFVIARIAIKMVFYGSQCAVWEALRPPAPVFEAVPEPAAGAAPEEEPALEPVSDSPEAAAEPGSVEPEAPEPQAEAEAGEQAPPAGAGEPAPAADERPATSA